MIVRTLAVGSMLANCYLVWCDPGGEGRRILAEIAREQLQVKYIVNTHGHVDHITANAEVRRDTGARLAIHEEDAPLLGSPDLNLSVYVGSALQGIKPDMLLHEGDWVACGKQVRLKVLHTPGHTRGGICLQGESEIFTGDTLFAESIGRTDFPGGSHHDLIDSIKNKILVLDDAYLVYPGHGPATTVGHERKYNPFLG